MDCAWEPPAAVEAQVPQGWSCIAEHVRGDVAHRLWRSADDAFGLQLSFTGPAGHGRQHGTLDVSWDGAPPRRLWLEVGPEAFVPLGQAQPAFGAFEVYTFAFDATLPSGWGSQVRMQDAQGSAWYTVEATAADATLYFHPMGQDLDGKPFPSIGERRWDLGGEVVGVQVAQVRGDRFTFEVPSMSPLPDPLGKPACVQDGPR